MVGFMGILVLILFSRFLLQWVLFIATPKNHSKEHVQNLPSSTALNNTNVQNLQSSTALNNTKVQQVQDEIAERKRKLKEEIKRLAAENEAWRKTSDAVNKAQLKAWRKAFDAVNEAQIKTMEGLDEILERLSQSSRGGRRRDRKLSCPRA